MQRDQDKNEIQLSLFNGKIGLVFTRQNEFREISEKLDVIDRGKRMKHIKARRDQVIICTRFIYFL